MPDAMVAGCHAVFNDEVYIFGGRKSNGSYSNEIWKYTPATDEWTSLGKFPPFKARVSSSACVVDDYIYLGLGYTGPIHRDTAYMRDFWAYAPSTNTWKRLADFPSNTTVKNCLFVTGDEIFAVYGFYRQFTQDVYRYEIQNNQWKKVEFKSSLNIPRAMDVVGATCQGRHFVGTGFNHGSLRFWAEWDPIQHQWIARKKILGAGRNAAACCATDDYIYLVGGRHYGDSLTTGFFYNSIQRYSPSQDKWEYIGCIPYEAENMVSVSVRNQIFIGLGENPDGEIQNYWYRIEE
jgi:N-acetylneuraminic acid mutarotase